MSEGHISLLVQAKPIYYEVLHDVLPHTVLKGYPVADILQMASRFCHNAAEQPAVCFSINGFECVVSLDKLPNRLILELGTTTPDPDHVFADWGLKLFSNNGGEDGQAGHRTSAPAHYVTSPPGKQARALPLGENELYPQEIVVFLRRFCLLELTDGSSVTDCPIYCSLYRGHKVLHGLRDVYPWSRIQDITILSRERAVREAEKFGIYDKRGLMPLVFDLFTPLRGQRVVAIIKTGSNRDVNIYGDVKPQASPSGIVEIGDTEMTYDRVVFMALTSEVDAMSKHKHHEHK